MLLFRRGFYLLAGFTFPGFWALHASGLWAGLYMPLQRLCSVDGAGWPSFLTACLVYLAAIACFEGCYRLCKQA